VVAATNEELSGRCLLLEVALEAKIRVSLNQHLVIHRSVGLVASGAALPDGFVFKDKGAALGDMTASTGVGLTRERKRATFYGITLMRVVAIAAGYFTRNNGMAVRQVEFSAYIQVTLETDFWRFVGINDGIARTDGFRVHAAGSVTALTTNVLRVCAVGFQPRVGRGGEVFRDFSMTISAVF